MFGASNDTMTYIYVLNFHGQLSCRWLVFNFRQEEKIEKKEKKIEEEERGVEKRRKKEGGKREGSGKSEDPLHFLSLNPLLLFGNSA